jgi:hypothetical protein
MRIRIRIIKVMKSNGLVTSSATKLHYFNADPDPTFHFNADPDHQSDANLRPLGYNRSTASF